MNTSISKQISARMKAKNLSVTMLEREAGLKTHAVQNILRGKSKNPSAKLLQSIADVLGCTIKELFEHQELFEDDNSSTSKNSVLDSAYSYSNLFLEASKLVHEKLKEQQANVSNKQMMTCVEEIFSHSLQKDPSQVDESFADWFIDLLLESKR